MFFGSQCSVIIGAQLIYIIVSKPLFKMRHPGLCVIQLKSRKISTAVFH